MFQRYLHRLLRRIAPPRNPKSWEMPVDTMRARHDLLDLALIHISIATRNQGVSDGEGKRRNGTDDAGEIKGHYVEFGVFRGETFRHVCKRAENLMPWMKFFAFDSFQGLPEPTGLDANAEFTKGQFNCDQETFVSNLAADKVDLSRVSIIPGWFDHVLVDPSLDRHLTNVSLAYIDCDLYSSTVPVLRFLTKRITQGTILFFDDWYCFRADGQRGVQRATSEWLSHNQNLSLTPWQAFSHHGHAFFVNKVDSE